MYDIFYFIWLRNILFSLPFMLLCLGAFLVCALISQLPINTFWHTLLRTRWKRLTGIMCSVIFVAVLTFPLWIQGDKSSSGNADDTHLILTSHLTASAPFLETTNWSSVIAGGNDERLLPGAWPFTLTRLYSLFLPPWGMMSFVAVANVLLVLIFSWKILTEVMCLNGAVAVLGSITLSVIQGYWAGKWPDSHVSHLHGMAIVPALLYFLHKYFNSNLYYVIVVGISILYTLSTPIIFHDLPSALISIGAWLVFHYPKNFIRVALTILLFSIFALALNFEYLASVILTIPLSSRALISNSIRLDIRYVTLGAVSALSFLVGCKVGLFRELRLIRYVFMLLISALVPVVAYGLQEMRLFSSFRWNILFSGSYVLSALPLVFIFERVVYAFRQKSLLLANWFTTIIVVTVLSWLATVILASIVFDISLSGRWGYLTKNTLINDLIESESEPFRALNYGTDTDIFMLGWYQGVETVNGYANFINKKNIQIFTDMSKDGEADVRSLYVRDNLSKDLSRIYPQYLALVNVKYVFSKVPLDDQSLLLYAVQHPRETPTCLIEPVIVNTIFDLKAFQYIQCVIEKGNFTESLYVYKLKNTLPRIYLASQVVAAETFPDKLSFIEFTQRGGAAVENGVQSILTLTDKFAIGDLLKIVEYKPGRITIRVKSNSPRFVVVSQTTSDYWNLLLNGQRSPFYTVNVAQTGFVVNAGDTIATLAYCPPFSWRRDQTCTSADNK